MKSKPILTFSLAIASLALVSPAFLHAQDQDPASPATNMNSGTAAADQMVPAQAALKTTIDARKEQPGGDFAAVLTQKVRLKDGTELPKGTTLMGKVETDSLQSSGKSTLTLNFTEAKLKDGKQVPIKATIVGVAPPNNGALSDQQQTQILSPWDGRSSQFDQVGALSGIDLHSQISGDNSGTFVSSKKDVKLSDGSQLALAIGANGNA